HGWATVDAIGVSRALNDYRDFIQESKAEFGVAKHTYVATRSGWFSDRTECYLASGRPALVQDTGWTAHLPHGDGLLAFSSPDERWPASIGSTATTRRTPVGRSRSRAITLARTRCCAHCWTHAAAENCARGAGGDA